jgi:hypothetical protein
VSAFILVVYLYGANSISGMPIATYPSVAECKQAGEAWRNGLAANGARVENHAYYTCVNAPSKP